MRLADARALALAKRAEIVKGANPVAEKRKAKAVASKDWTVRELVADYREKVLINLAKSTRTCYGRHLKRIENKLGPLGVREVDSGDIVVLIEEAKLTWGECSLLHITAKGLFTHACGKRLVNVNPCAGIRLTSLLGPRPPVRKRLMLTRQELHLLLNAKMRRTNALAVRLLLATGVRGSELASPATRHQLSCQRWVASRSPTAAQLERSACMRIGVDRQRGSAPKGGLVGYVKPAPAGSK